MIFSHLLIEDIGSNPTDVENVIDVELKFSTKFAFLVCPLFNVMKKFRLFISYNDKVHHIHVLQCT